MSVEIERKFLVANDSWRNEVRNKFQIKQGYLNSSFDKSVRVRTKGDKGYLTIKGATKNISRLEFEYKIPLDDAEKLMTLCQSPIIEKVRHEVSFGDHIWEIDEFYSENKGLIIAELELKSEDQVYKIPEWLGDEVSDNPHYYNLNLVQKPYSTWQ